MSRNEIANMSVEERIRLMEEIWASFEQNGEEYPAPEWHEKVLREREDADESRFLPFEEVRRRLQAELDAY